MPSNLTGEALHHYAIAVQVFLASVPSLIGLTLFVSLIVLLTGLWGIVGSCSPAGFFLDLVCCYHHVAFFNPFTAIPFFPGWRSCGSAESFDMHTESVQKRLLDSPQLLNSILFYCGGEKNKVPLAVTVMATGLFEFSVPATFCIDESTFVFCRPPWCFGQPEQGCSRHDFQSSWSSYPC